MYDAEGRIREVIQDFGGLNHSTKIAYDVDNNLREIIDPKSGTYTASYEMGTGNLVDATNPLNEKYEFSYDSSNNLVQEIDPENRVNNNSYDQSNNQTESTDAYTQTSASRYLPNGNIDYETGLISAGENIVSNSSAERDANLDKIGRAHV